MRYPIAALVIAVACATLGGCGQTGPLYLPPEEAPPSQPAEQADNNPQPTESA